MVLPRRMCVLLQLFDAQFGGGDTALEDLFVPLGAKHLVLENVPNPSFSLSIERLPRISSIALRPRSRNSCCPFFRSDVFGDHSGQGARPSAYAGSRCGQTGVDRPHHSVFDSQSLVVFSAMGIDDFSHSPAIVDDWRGEIPLADGGASTTVSPFRVIVTFSWWSMIRAGRPI